MTISFNEAVTNFQRDLNNLDDSNNRRPWHKPRNGRAAKSAIELTKAIKVLTPHDYSSEVIDAIKFKLPQFEAKFKSMKTKGGFTRTFCCPSTTKAHLNMALKSLGALRDAYYKDNPSEAPKATSTPQESSTYAAQLSARARFLPSDDVSLNSYQRLDEPEASSTQPLLGSAAQESNRMEEWRGDFLLREPKTPPRKPTRMVEGHGDFYLSEPESQPQKHTRMVEGHGDFHLTEPETNPDIDTRSAAQVREDYHYHK